MAQKMAEALSQESWGLPRWPPADTSEGVSRSSDTPPKDSGVWGRFPSREGSSRKWGGQWPMWYSIVIVPGLVDVPPPFSSLLHLHLPHPIL